MHTNIIISNFLIFFIAHGQYAEEICPQKVTSGDRFKATERFEALRKAVTMKLAVTHTHTEPRRTRETYTYEISLCGVEGSAAIEQKDKKTKTIVAEHDQASIYFGGEDWLMIRYFHGKNYTPEHHCHGQARQGILSVRCEEDGEEPHLILIEEARFKSSKDNHPETPCYYLFEYNHPAACNKIGKKLSGGAIFCIILVVVAATYLICGFLYQRFIVGAKGWEQIPNFSFWKIVGNMSADGCDFVCRREERPSTYKGMADALDIDSSDDDKDDGLLPM